MMMMGMSVDMSAFFCLQKPSCTKEIEERSRIQRGFAGRDASLTAGYFFILGGFSMTEQKIETLCLQGGYHPGKWTTPCAADLPEHNVP